MRSPQSDIVVCAVGITGSPAAVAAAAEEATRAGTGLHLVHVTADEGDEVRRLLGAAVARAHAAQPDLQITQEVVDLVWVASGLAEAGAGARCVVIERSHRNQAQRLLAGSTASSVAYQVQAPVMSVPHDWAASVNPPAVVTVGVQDADEAPALVALGLTEARARGAVVVVVHATGPGQHLDDIGIRTDWIDRAHRDLDPVVEALRREHSDIEVRLEIVLSTPADALVAASSESQVLVVGRRHHDHLWGTNIGPVVRRVLLDAKCPVLLPPDLEHAPPIRRAPVPADEQDEAHATPGDVVVAVDQDTGGSVRFAVAEAEARAAGVHLVHVVQIPGVDGVSVLEIWHEAVADGRRVLERAAEQARAAGRPGLRVSTHLVDQGGTVSALVAESKHAEALVIQHRHLGRARRLVTRSITNGVAARSDVPVIVVPADWSSGPERVGCVVAGIADADDVDRVVGAAVDEAQRRGLPLRVVHAGPLDPDERAALDRAIDEVAAASPAVTVHRVFDDHDPVPLLVGARSTAELVVLGRRHRSMPWGSHLGPVTRAVLEASSFPVMLLP